MPAEVFKLGLLGSSGIDAVASSGIADDQGELLCLIRRWLVGYRAVVVEDRFLMLVNTGLEDILEEWKPFYDTTGDLLGKFDDAFILTIQSNLLHELRHHLVLLRQRDSLLLQCRRCQQLADAHAPHTGEVATVGCI